MLRKMGWREGEGLGKDRSGEVDPLQLDIKMDKKGLISAEEMVGKGKSHRKFFLFFFIDLNKPQKQK